MSFLHFTDTKHFKNRFNFFRDIFLIIGIFFAGISMLYPGMQTEESKEVASATFVNNIYKQFNSDHYDPIVIVIEGDNTPHSSNYPILNPKDSLQDQILMITSVI